MYPLGWESSEVKQICGIEARVFKLGMIILFSTIFCSVLKVVIVENVYY